MIWKKETTEEKVNEVHRTEEKKNRKRCTTARTWWYGNMCHN